MVCNSKHCQESLNDLMYTLSFDDYWAIKEYVSYKDALDYADYLRQKEELNKDGTGR